jgi:hypothetical protein
MPCNLRLSKNKIQMGNQITKRLPRILGVAILLICLPFTARANAGTPLMWASMLHLAIGNVFIGIFEGLILAWIFKLRTRTCIITMIPANYFSAWAGGLFLNYKITQSLPFNLYNAWHWFWIMVAFTYLMTLILEWPFVFFCFRKEPNKFRKSLRGNLLVNSLSYVLLFGWYWMASGTTLYTKMNVVQPSGITFPKQGFVYFISETNGVCTLDLNSHQIEKICTLNEVDRDDRLFIRTSALDTNNWDILNSSKKITVSSNLQAMAAQCWRDTNDMNRIEGSWFNFGNAPKLGAAEKSDWTFGTGFWPIEGFWGTNQKTGERVHFSLETPFVAWIARNATHLPGDYVVFQLGDNQICLLEASTKKIALLAKGQGPVVIIPKENSKK